MYFYYFICNFIISIYSKMLACCSYLKIRIQIQFIVFYCIVSGFVCMCICVCLTVNTITQKIRNILIQNFAHTFAIAHARKS